MLVPAVVPSAYANRAGKKTIAMIPADKIIIFTVFFGIVFSYNMGYSYIVLLLNLYEISQRSCLIDMKNRYFDQTIHFYYKTTDLAAIPILCSLNTIRL
jgi:hypothetical protein